MAKLIFYLGFLLLIDQFKSMGTLIANQNRTATKIDGA